VSIGLFSLRELAESYLAWCFREETPPRADEVAGYAGLSRSNFSRQFREEVGEPPGRYLKRRQLEEAAKMLDDSQTSLESIAYQNGFGTRRTLFRSFRRIFGTTPRNHTRA
jgi:AraC-like DNA-binding protein